MQKVSIQNLYDLFLESSQKICTDTRKIEKDSIFFALKGDNFNANEFAGKAIELGCAYAVVDEEHFATSSKTLLVDNVLSTLQQLANYHRKQCHMPFLGITGSNAKTTTKELIAAVLSKKYNTLATVGNLNNHIGVPLTILSVTQKHQFAIIEMGANHQGEIDQLCQIAEPDFGLITNIGKAHLEGFGGIEGVKKGKSEMYRFIKGKNGKLFVNADDEVLLDLAAGMQMITYGSNQQADVVGYNCSEQETVALQFKDKNNPAPMNQVPIIRTHLVGHYNYINCLAACCVGKYFGVEDHAIVEALSTYQPNMNRSQLVHTKNNAIILDAYNANPNSMRVAIDNFAKMKAEHKLLLLGDMFELGDYAAKEHQAIVDLLIEKEFKQVILVGPMFKKTTHDTFHVFENTEACGNYLKTMQFQNHYVLIKGSRGMKMETLQVYL